MAGQEDTDVIEQWARWAFAAILILTVGCSGDETVDETTAGLDALPFVVPLGKEDNFFSQTSQEYLVEGTTTITLGAEDASLSAEEQLQKVKRLIPFKQVVINWFLNSLIVSKSNDATNASYGNYHAITKNGSYEELAVEAVEGAELTWRFTFRQELAGPFDLLDKMEITHEGERAFFDLIIGKISNEDMQLLETDKEWYRKAPWKKFDPTTVDADKLDTLKLEIRPQPRSLDAWPDYARLFADGKVTMGVHFGWDYHKEYHLKHSKAVYDWLVSIGFSSPVDSYDDLAHDSGPLKRTIRANGKDVAVEISLFWGKPGSGSDADTDAGGKQLEKDAIESLEKREVMIYSGHSGPFYGFAIGNWRKTSEGDLDDSEIPKVAMPYDTYQVVLAEGCETYALGQAFWANPAKSDQKNLDIITTNSFSNASTPAAVKDFIGSMVGTGFGSNDHTPITYGALLRDLDNNSFWFTTMYGVHGIDDNPRLHPYADPSSFCSACGADEDCGAAGNSCVRLEAGGVCTAACTGDDGCPGGYTCAAVAYGESITGRSCVPTNLSCDTPSPADPTVIFNEILADPPLDLAGDANADGTRSATEDEFVELVNHGDVAVELGGYTIADGVGVRFTFPAGALLAPGAAAVVFGGGDATAVTTSDLTRVFTATDGLGLNNSGDALLLRAADGRLIDEMTYGAEGGQDRSLVRATDGDPASSWTLHPGDLPFSPAARADGTLF